MLLHLAPPVSQDLSVAGKRAGLKHTENGDDDTTRSGLFMEAIRIIKEMREATNGAYPRFALWENVPGAFSSNKGEDFRVVLEEFIKVVEPTAVMPDVPKNGWPYSDVYCGDGWSLAYRVLDAQYWGVPQRRRRIYLVADFRGGRAGKVSFEREGLRGYFTQSRPQREAVTRDAEGGSGAADCRGGGITYALDQQGGKGGANFAEEVMPTLCSDSHGTPHAVAQPVTYDARGNGDGETVSTLTGDHENRITDYTSVVVYESHPMDSRIKELEDGISPTVSAKWHKGAADTPLVVEGAIPIHDQATRFSGKRGDNYDGKGNGLGVGEAGDPMNTLTSGDRHAVVYAIEGNGARPSHLGDGYSEADAMYTLNTIERHAVAYAMQGFGDYKESDVASGLKARDFKDATGLVASVEPASFYPQMKAESQCFRQDGIGNTLVNGTNPGFQNAVVQPIALDRAFFNQGQNAQYDPQFYTDGTVPTLVAKGPGAVAVRYVVRRLTPTECARLQGFPDTWGHPDIKNELTDEEYSFWLDVRNTHAAINGKATKEYTKEQMLTWYNKLHTDSSEYKMWGNGIALPCALYVMQGIADDPSK